MRIDQYLEQLGFNDSEAKLYLELAGVGKSPAALLAKRTNIPRTTAYSILENLVSKGVVSEEKLGNTTQYAINSTESLIRLIDREQQELKQKRNIAEELQQLIKPYLKTENYSIPRIQFFEGKENVENMLYEYVEQWQQSIAQYDYTWWGYQDHTFVENYLEYIEWTWERMNECERVKLFSNQAVIEEKLKGKKSHRNIRPVTEQFSFSSSIWVVGDYIVLIMTAQRPHYAFQMKDAVFAANLRSVFQMLWAATD